MCKELGVSRSGYYAWGKRPVSPREQANAALSREIREVFEQSRGTYGSPRITAALRDRGHTVNEKRVARLMRAAGISAPGKARFRVQTTDSDHDLPISANRLEQNFKVSAPNLVWVSDITYVATDAGWGYLCAIKDLFHDEIVGWSFERHMRTEMVIAALRDAVRKKRPQPGLIFHSDRGSQYASHEFREELKKFEFLSSMSRKGNCYDNAPSESFFGRFKVEEVYRKKYRNHEEGKINIFDYIECFYNRTRKHSRLGYMSPVQYLENFERRIA
jgi:putative transposase